MEKLRKATKKTFEVYDEGAANDLLNNFKSEEGKIALVECIKACKENYTSLCENAQLTSMVIKSALLELAMEESSKAYYTCVLYIYLFEIKKAPIWADTETIKNRPPATMANMFRDIFKGHRLKGSLALMGRYAPLEYPDRFREMVINAAKEKRQDVRMALYKANNYLKEIEKYKNIDFEKIKENGFYVDFDIKTLKLSKPTAANEDEMKEMEFMIATSNKNVEEFLRVIGESVI